MYFLKLNNLFRAIQPCNKKSYFHRMKKGAVLWVILVLLMGHFGGFAQGNDDTVIYLPMKMQIPGNAIKKGHIKAGNNATDVNCDYEGVIAEAKSKAIKMGGNIIKVTALIPPAFISKCYRIEADIYYCSDRKDPVFQRKAKAGIVESPGNYVLIYIYRLKDTTMLAPSYNLHLNDETVLCYVRSRSRDSIKI